MPGASSQTSGAVEIMKLIIARETIGEEGVPYR
jgi:hypothetical protein